MNETNRLDALAAHLSAIGAAECHRYSEHGAIAIGIIAAPQVHLNALNEAGLVKDVGTYCRSHGLMAFNADGSPSSCRWCGGDHVAVYAVVAPHKHDWRVVTRMVPGRDWTDPDPGLLLVGCACGANGTVPNRLPIVEPS